jgi:murein DD-endopeptidase MepM/ murein hydrolase activator NlpD
MTRKYPSRRAFVLYGAAVSLCASFINASAQELPLAPAVRSGVAASTQTPGVRHALVKQAAKRSGKRSLIKIRARAGDTLSLLGDRFGASAEDIAVLNGIAVGAQLKPGSELLIPLPTPESLARISAEKLAQHSSGNIPGADNTSSVETKDAWENVQGVWFRKGSAARSNERDVTEIAVGDKREGATKAAGNSSSSRIIEVSDAERSTVAQPVWIYLVGGARVEADSVNETTEGVWYMRGRLSIFIERSRIERIEHEREMSKLDESRAWTERGWSTGNTQFDALIKENGSRFGVDPYLIFCVMEQESQFKPKIVSPKGARGLMQLMPGTAAHFGVRRPFDPAENIMGGTKYLKQLLENFNGRVDLVLAGYNAGEGAVMKYGGNVPPYKETRNYVKRISQRYGQSQSPTAPVAQTPIVASRLR